MIATILIAALTAPPLELHVVPHTRDCRFIVACLHHDLRVVDEDTAAARYYQERLRESVTFRDSLDCFLQIGQSKAKLPQTAFDSHRMMILALKREVDDWNGIQRNHYRNYDVYYWVADGKRWPGMPKTTYPYPWESGYELLPWNDPGIREMTDFHGVSGVQMEQPAEE